MRETTCLSGDFQNRAAGERKSLSGEKRLTTIIVSTGRSGTVSCADMVEHLFRSSERRVQHEYLCREFFRAFCEFQETKDPSQEIELRRMVAGCPHDCIVGNGYAPVLPLFAEHYGSELTLVHLRRRDRQACIASLMRNAEIYPQAYGYYAGNEDFRLAADKRMAAFHFGEMSREEWMSLPSEARFAWYYDKTHKLIEEHSTLFTNYVEIDTEELDHEATRRILARAVGVEDRIPPPMHLNALQVAAGSIDPARQQYLYWLLYRLNLAEVASDRVKMLDYFIEKFIAWTGYEITRAPQLDLIVPPPTATIERDLARAEDLLSKALTDVRSLRDMLRERDRSPEPDPSASPSD